MKESSKGFRFLGFVALADCLFAVSAGLLLLNPIRLTSSATEESETDILPRSVELQVVEIETAVEQLEANTQVLWLNAAEVMKNE
jgi:hypothetical protein